jgi:hypothetical protein
VDSGEGLSRASSTRCFFAKVQEIILARAKRYSDDEMLARLLKGLWPSTAAFPGCSSTNRTRCRPAPPSVIASVSLVRAYQLVGYTPRTDYSFLEINRYLRGRHPEVVQEVITRLTAMGVAVERDPATQMLILDHELTVSLVLSRCLRTETGSSRWMLRFEESFRPDLTIAVRMDETNQAIKDYYLFPALDLADAAPTPVREQPFAPRRLSLR